MVVLGTENDSKLSNLPEDNHTKDEVSECIEPSECKIPKTDSGDSAVKEEPPSEVIEVKIVYNKNKYDVSAPGNTTIADFKKQLQNLLGKTQINNANARYCVTCLWTNGA